MRDTGRLVRVLGYLKEEFFAAGDEWLDTRESRLLDELNALVGAINQIEIFIYDRPITTLLDIH